MKYAKYNNYLVKKGFYGWIKNIDVPKCYKLYSIKIKNEENQYLTRNYNKQELWKLDIHGEYSFDFPKICIVNII